MFEEVQRRLWTYLYTLHMGLWVKINRVSSAVRHRRTAPLHYNSFDPLHYSSEPPHSKQLARVVYLFTRTRAALRIACCSGELLKPQSESNAPYSWYLFPIQNRMHSCCIIIVQDYIMRVVRLMNVSLTNRQPNNNVNIYILVQLLFD